MHTAEHILNGVMSKKFDKGRSFSNHIEKKKSKCDYHFDRDLIPEEIEEITLEVNEVIKSHHHVTEEFIPREEAELKYNLEKIPDETEDTIRIIKVGNFDACPCSGPHVKNTSEIGEFIFGSSSFESGILRLRWKIKRPE
nr:hypothetical protein [uncultured Sphaerochaeta sp.]